MTLLHIESLSAEFRQIEDLCDQKDSITLGGILELLEHRGHALFTLFLAGPFILPIPLPGLSVPFGAFIVFFAFSMAFDRQPLIPKSWLRRELPKAALRKFSRMAQAAFRKFEALFKPRMVWMIDFRAGQVVIAIMIAICGFLLALPLPPGTNAPPAAAIVALSIGLLERDGLLVLLGFCLFLANIAFFTFLSVYGYEGVLKLINLI
ncbi:MAG: exopolysaccharide biosynthesis protein [Chitinophagaceae bacterium]|nr:exopolysaccharide biosynthesis protein [Oligoflexus sp.]